MGSRALTNFRRGISFLRAEVNNDLPIQQVQILLEVNDNEGITMPELMKKVGMSQASVSKNIKTLSRFKDKDEIRGYDLVYTEQDMSERRRFAVFLTDRGQRVVKALDEIMGARLEP